MFSGSLEDINLLLKIVRAWLKKTQRTIDNENDGGNA